MKCKLIALLVGFIAMTSMGYKKNVLIETPTGNT